MRVEVNGSRLYFDVEGAGLVPNGPALRERPTLLLLHGGPGFDHSIYKPSFSALADIAQVVYLDHRGNGRSDRADPSTWNLDQWADDVRGFCEALEIERPIVFGNSFGGIVAMAYAGRHPDHPGKLVLSSTTARQNLPRMLERFELLGGSEARAAAERFWQDPSPETLGPYAKQGFALYNQTPSDPDAMARTTWSLDVMFEFCGTKGSSYDLFDGLSRVRCPTLVLGGELDPVCPIEDQEEIAAALPSEWTRFERFPGCGHGVFRDEPERGFAVIREFLLA